MDKATYLPLDPSQFFEYTETTAISATIICLILMVLFIHFFSARLNFDRSHRRVDFGPQQRDMVKVSNPFVLELDNRPKYLQEGVSVRISILCPCHVVVVWGPRIQALHRLILRPGRIMRGVLLTDVDNTLLDPLHCQLLNFETSGDHKIDVPCPAGVTSDTLGQMPRERYPLAIFMFTPSEKRPRRGSRSLHSGDEVHTQGSEETDNTIIGLFSIIHLKDNIVSKDSHIIAKYVKTAGVPIYSLQVLFAAPTEEENVPKKKAEKDCTASNSFSTSISNGAADAFTESDETTKGEQQAQHIAHFDYVKGAVPEGGRELDNCVVCQTRRARCAILPCRHCCVCFRCFLLLDRCPMCRNKIGSYFFVGSLSDSDGEEADDEADDDSPHCQEIQRGIADRINLFFETVNRRLGFG